MATLPRGVPKCSWPHCGRKKRARDDFFVKYPCHTHKYKSGASNLYQKKLKTCKERPFLQAGNLILEMRSKTGQCHPVCHIDFSCSELHISRQSDDYPARRGFFNGYHPYNRGICSLWRTFQQHLFKVFRWDRGSSPEKRLGSKTGDSSLKEAKSKRRYLGARGRAFCVCDQNCGFSCKCTQQKPAMEMTCECSCYSPAKNTTINRKILFNIVFIVLWWGKLPCRSGQRNIQSDRQILIVPRLPLARE